jgi:GntR family transcriptional regulator, transcriptional repressor for pyruvate dehydrogenase complex
MGLMQKQPPFIVRPVRVSRAYEELASMIRQRIVSGELGEGDRIPSESALAKDAQVSRSTVREALRTLEESGLIERTSPKIMVVRRPSEERAYRELHRALRRRNVTFHHLHEALLVLEPELTRLATTRADSSGIAQLEINLQAQAASVGDFAEWNRLDQEFHLTIAEMSANPALVIARSPISDLLMPVLRRFVVSREHGERALDAHHRILEEIQARDPEAAALMVRKHVNEMRTGWERAGLNFDAEIGEFTDEAGNATADHVAAH